MAHRKWGKIASAQIMREKTKITTKVDGVSWIREEKRNQRGMWKGGAKMNEKKKRKLSKKVSVLLLCLATTKCARTHFVPVFYFALFFIFVPFRLWWCVCASVGWGCRVHCKYSWSFSDVDFTATSTLCVCVCGYEVDSEPEHLHTRSTFSHFRQMECCARLLGSLANILPNL